jgi:cytoskeletal protein CcmA (bactofilin family)
MGRKTEQSGDNFQAQTPDADPSYIYSTQANQNRAMSESESMARDIKEGRLSGFVGNGTVLTGETNFQAMLRVDGHLTGKVTSENGTLIIGSTGRVDANITVAAATINGTVNGDIIATEKVELGRTARIAGNIHTPRMTMDEGALLEGGCSMIQARETADKRNADINSKYAAATEPETPVYEEVEEFETAEADETEEYSLTAANDDDADEDEDEESAEAATS